MLINIALLIILSGILNMKISNDKGNIVENCIMHYLKWKVLDLFCEHDN